MSNKHNTSNASNLSTMRVAGDLRRPPSTAHPERVEANTAADAMVHRVIQSPHKSPVHGPPHVPAFVPRTEPRPVVSINCLGEPMDRREARTAAELLSPSARSTHDSPRSEPPTPGHNKAGESGSGNRAGDIPASATRSEAAPAAPAAPSPAIAGRQPSIAKARPAARSSPSVHPLAPAVLTKKDLVPSSPGARDLLPSLPRCDFLPECGAHALRTNAEKQLVAAVAGKRGLGNSGDVTNVSSHSAVTEGSRGSGDPPNAGAAHPSQGTAASIEAYPAPYCAVVAQSAGNVDTNPIVVDSADTLTSGGELSTTAGCMGSDQTPKQPHQSDGSRTQEEGPDSSASPTGQPTSSKDLQLVAYENNAAARRTASASQDHAGVQWKRTCLLDPSIAMYRKYVSYWRHPADALSPGVKFGAWGRDGPPGFEIVPRSLASVRREEEAESRAVAAAAYSALCYDEFLHANREDANPSKSSSGKQGAGAGTAAGARSHPTMASSPRMFHHTTRVYAAAIGDNAVATSRMLATADALQGKGFGGVPKDFVPMQRQQTSGEKPGAEPQRWTDEDSATTLSAGGRTDECRDTSSPVAGSRFKRPLSFDLSDDEQDDDVLDVYHLFDAQRLSGRPKLIERARNEAFRLIREERKAKQAALKSLERTRHQLDSERASSRRTAAQRVTTERLLRAARDVAEAKAADVQIRAHEDGKITEQYRLQVIDLERQVRELKESLEDARQEATAASEALSAERRQAVEERRQAAEERRLEENELKSKLGPLFSGKAQLETHLKEAEDRIASLQQQVERAEAARDEESRGRRNAQEERLLTEQARHQAVRDACEAKAQNHALEADLQKANREISTLQQSVQELTAAKTSAEESVRLTQELAQEEKLARQQAESALQEAESRINSGSTKVSALTSERNAAETKLQTMESHLQREAESIRMQLHAETTSRSMAETARQTAEARLKSETEARQRADTERLLAEEALAKERSEHAKVQGKVAEHRAAISRLEAELACEKHNVAMLQRQVESEKKLRENVTYARRASLAPSSPALSRRGSVAEEGARVAAEASKAVLENKLADAQRQLVLEKELRAEMEGQVNVLKRAMQEQHGELMEREERVEELANRASELATLLREKDEAAKSKSDTGVAGDLVVAAVTERLRIAQRNAREAKAELESRLQELEYHKRAGNEDLQQYYDDILERERDARVAAEKLATEERLARRRAEATWSIAESDLRTALEEANMARKQAERRYMKLRAKQADLVPRHDGASVVSGASKGSKSSKGSHVSSAVRDTPASSVAISATGRSSASPYPFSRSTTPAIVPQRAGSTASSKGRRGRDRDSQPDSAMRSQGSVSATEASSIRSVPSRASTDSLGAWDAPASRRGNDSPVSGTSGRSRSRSRAGARARSRSRNGRRPGSSASSQAFFSSEHPYPDEIASQATAVSVISTLSPRTVSTRNRSRSAGRRARTPNHFRPKPPVTPPETVMDEKFMAATYAVFGCHTRCVIDSPSHCVKHA